VKLISTDNRLNLEIARTAEYRVGRRDRAFHPSSESIH